MQRSVQPESDKRCGRPVAKCSASCRAGADCNALNKVISPLGASVESANAREASAKNDDQLRAFTLPTDVNFYYLDQPMGCPKITYYQEGEGLEKSTVHFLGDLEEKKFALKFCDSYYPFGGTFNHWNSSTVGGQNYYKYNSFEEQQETGWYDYQARYYDPALGRFLNVDPAADLMRRHSPYNYAFDNPIRFIDPDGMMPQTGDQDPKEKEKQQEDQNQNQEEPEESKSKKDEADQDDGKTMYGDEWCWLCDYEMLFEDAVTKNSQTTEYVEEPANDDPPESTNTPFGTFDGNMPAQVSDFRIVLTSSNNSNDRENYVEVNSGSNLKEKVTLDSRVFIERRPWFSLGKSRGVDSTFQNSNGNVETDKWLLRDATGRYTKTKIN